MDKELIAGALAGSLAALVVVPLDIVKVRKQYWGNSALASGSTFHCLQQIVYREGLHSLYRGSIPSVFGYLCSWSCYFAIYTTMRTELQHYSSNSSFNAALLDSLAATTAGFASTTLASPIWVIRTKFMLQQQRQTAYETSSLLQTIRQTWSQNGLKGFWAGLSPSYLGLMHVAIQWPVYEFMRVRVASIASCDVHSNAVVLGASMCAKLAAALVTYPHEVLRTRMQTASAECRLTLLGTIGSIWRREGAQAFYRGLSTSLIRQVPVTAVVLVVHNSIVREWR